MEFEKFVICFLTAMTLLLIAMLYVFSLPAHARGTYPDASPKIREWYRSQHNAQGQWCCDKSDGHPYYGAYTINKDGSVTIGNRRLPAYMVLTGPNPTGHAVWWWIEVNGQHTDFCFAPGTLI